MVLLSLRESRVYSTDTVVVTIVGAAADQGALRLDAELQTNITHAISLFQKIISQLRLLGSVSSKNKASWIVSSLVFLVRVYLYVIK